MTNTPSVKKMQIGSTRVTRRNLVKSAVAAGLTIPVLGRSSVSAAPRRSLLRQDAEKPAALNMLYATVEADVEAIKLAIPDFKAETGIDIVLDSQPYDALQQKVFAELAVDSPYYDVIIVDTPWTPALTGKLEPLSGYLTNEALNDVSDPALD